METSTQRRKSKAIKHNWAIELQSVLCAKTREPQGKGWLTTEQFSELLGISIGTGLKYLRRGLASGHIERFDGTSKSPVGVRIQTWYRPVQKRK